MPYRPPKEHQAAGIAQANSRFYAGLENLSPTERELIAKARRRTYMRELGKRGALARYSKNQETPE